MYTCACECRYMPMRALHEISAAIQRTYSYRVAIYIYISVATGSQSGDPDDPLTHWLRPGDPDNDPVTLIMTRM